MATDIIVSEMTSATQINTNDLMIMTQPDLQAETGYSTKKGTVLQVANKMLKGTEYLTDLPDFTDKTVLGGLEELKGDLTALLPVNTASGAIANFDTDLSLSLVDCKANIVANQASGTPTPSSSLTINGYTEANITRCGVNLFDYSQTILSNMSCTSGVFTNTATDNQTVFRFQLQAMLDNSIVSLIAGGNISTTGKHYYNFTFPANCNYLMLKHNGGQTDLRIKFPFTKQGSYTISFNVTSIDPSTLGGLSFKDVQIEVGSQASDFTPYNGQTYTVSFGQTVYGGVLDLTRGKLTVTWGKKKGSEITWNYDTDNCFYGLISGKANGQQNILCSDYENAPSGSVTSMPDLSIKGNDGNAYVNIKNTNYGADDLTAFRTSMANVDIAYELATPFDIELTPTQINALLGVNNVYNDTNGDTEVKYKEGIQHYIDKKIAATQALIL